MRVLRRLGGGWPLLYGGIVFPAFIRDKVYDIVAGSRYRLFGRRDACLLPSAELGSRFAEDEDEDQDILPKR
ncbi:DCC1-like thiol-disulfide oxidoreductase family protein [Paenibacillus sepulcri]|uniref:DCC1-like thiol-disulfide oxidoreductase family protein n=1 Tax=Paenibacillus sepulcri TaxID=359917 RepID=A0ABS7C7P0_9BACL|nr:DCC1-like thiol-disulfide oxidoreductase family protein [Paenibacillus sepulcri]